MNFGGQLGGLAEFLEAIVQWWQVAINRYEHSRGKGREEEEGENPDDFLKNCSHQHKCARKQRKTTTAEKQTNKQKGNIMVPGRPGIHESPELNQGGNQESTDLNDSIRALWDPLELENWFSGYKTRISLRLFKKL